MAGILAIGGRCDNESMQFLLTPATLHEFTRQPIQQFRMSWSRALCAEIIFSRNQTLAEIVLPDPIHGHPCRQWIAPVHQPTGQIQPIRCSARFKRRQDSGNAWSHCDTLAQEVASNLDKGFAGLRQLLHNERTGYLRFLSGESRQTCLPLPESWICLLQKRVNNVLMCFVTFAGWRL